MITNKTISGSESAICRKSTVIITAGYLLFFLLMTMDVQADYRVISSSAKGKQAIIECVDQMYNFNFSKADYLSKQLAVEYPDHPAINLLSATNKYWQWFPACNNKPLEKQVRAQLEEASHGASRWMSGTGKDIPEAMFIYFSAEALLARMDNSQHATMATIGHARNAYPYVKKSFRLQKVYPDFILVAGMYNYFRVRYVEIKPIYKALVWFMQDGDKNEGLRQIKVASEISLFSKAEGGAYLADILTNYEKKPASALPGLYALLELYPDNLYLQSKLAEVLLSTENPETSLKYIMNLMESEIPGYKEIAIANRARYYLLKSNLNGAAADANQILTSKTRDEHLFAYAHQVLAQIGQRQGKLSLAKMHYKKVKEFSESPVQIDEADAYLKSH